MYMFILFVKQKCVSDKNTITSVDLTGNNWTV